MPADLRGSEELELDLRRYELRRSGRVVRLEKIPMELLIFLVENRNKLVSREAIIDRLWGKDVFLDTDQGINTAVRKIRQALHDDPDQPRFLQTVVSKGYRFVGSISVMGDGTASAPPNQAQPSPVQKEAAKDVSDGATWWKSKAVLGTLAALALAALILRYFGFLDGWFPRGPAVHSIAVLPLKNLSGDPAQEYFADGMTEVLITDLGTIRALRVISSTSTRRYQGTTKLLSEIGRELKVDAVVEGAVARSGDRVRVTARLVHLSTETQLWAQTYERDMSDVLLLQAELAGAIASEIRTQVAPQEKSRLASSRPVNRDAFRLYLQGRYLATKGGAPNTQKSIEYFQQAIQLDPSYALPYAGMADSYGLLSNAGALPPDEGYGKMKAAATKALELDEQLGKAHESLGYYYMVYEWNWPMASRNSGVPLN